MTEATDDEADPPGRRLKVARLVDEYDLGDIGAELEERWTAPRDERMSLRELADYFNRRLLARSLPGTATPLTGEAETLYTLLTDDDVSDADRTRARRRLEREDVEVDELLADFVSYGAVRTYLKERRDVEYDPDDRDQAVVEAENIQRLRGRTAAVTESKLEQLERSGDLCIGNHRTIVDVNVLCADCGRQFDVEDLLEQGSCDCDEASGEP